MASTWDYLSYGPQNPALSRIAQYGQQTGVQDLSKKGLTIASNAGRGFRQSLGYGERFNITQTQAGEIGYFAGSLVTPSSMLTKAGTELVGATTVSKGWALPGLLESPGKKVYYTWASDVVLNTKKAKEITWGSKLGANLPSLATTAKVGALAGGTYLGYKTLSTAGSWLDYLKPTVPGMPPVPNPVPNPDQIPTKKDATINPYSPYPVFDPYAGFWGNLGTGMGAFPAGAGTGLADIGAGTGASIVPLALVIGGVYLISGKGKKGKRKK